MFRKKRKHSNPSFQQYTDQEEREYLLTWDTTIAKEENKNATRTEAQNNRCKPRQPKVDTEFITSTHAQNRNNTNDTGVSSSQLEIHLPHIRPRTYKTRRPIPAELTASIAEAGRELEKLKISTHTKE